MNNLLKYVKNNFKTPSGIIKHFKDKFNINVKNEEFDGGGYFLFKYGIDPDFSNNIIMECRGQILKYYDKQWSIVSRPFDKFFNIGESLCNISPQKSINLVNYYITEKSDGTCIQVWYDDIHDITRISTLGTITTLEIEEYNITFEKLFLATLGVDFDKFNKVIKQNYKNNTLIFELCTDRNHILTHYPEDKVVLLACIDKESNYYNDIDLVVFNIKLFYKDNINIKPVYIFQFYDKVGVDKLKNEIALRTKDEKFGEIPEGVVLWDHKRRPIAKLKLDEYLNYKRFSDFDFNCSKNGVLEVFFDNKLDDYSHVFTPRLKKYADALTYEKNYVMDKICNVLNVTGKKYTSQKYFAMDVFKYCTGFGIPEFTDYIFRNQKNKIDFWEWCTMNDNQKNKIIKRFKKRLENKQQSKEIK